MTDLLHNPLRGDRYAKALLRRGLAHDKLGDLKNCAIDLEQAHTIDPSVCTRQQLKQAQIKRAERDREAKHGAPKVTPSLARFSRSLRSPP